MWMRFQVSVASRIVPSPDWFIGLDSFNLCIGGQWVDSVAVKVSREKRSKDANTRISMIQYCTVDRIGSDRIGSNWAENLDLTRICTDTSGYDARELN